MISKYKNHKINELINDFEIKTQEIVLRNVFKNKQNKAFKSYKELGKFLIVSQWDILFKEIKNFPEDKQLNFKYDTVKNINYAFEYFVLSMMKKSVKSNDYNYIHSILPVTVSYFYGLGISEHNCRIKVLLGNGKNPPYWEEEQLSIRIGTKEKLDLLHYFPSLKVSVDNKEELALNLTSLINAYENAFGVDLREHGLEEIIYIHPTESNLDL